MRVDWPVASALARARMLGRVWTWIRSVDELRPGDHIAFNTGAVYYYQHAIVTRLQGILAIDPVVISLMNFCLFIFARFD